MTIIYIHNYMHKLIIERAKRVHYLFMSIDIADMFAFHMWAFPVYPGNTIEVILSILEISGNFNVRSSLHFQL